MNLEKHKRIFNLISPIYNLFFNGQVIKYCDIYNSFSQSLGISKNSNILDLGCGTGAFAKAFSLQGHILTGVDMSENMLKYAKSRGINSLFGNVVQGLKFDDKSFDHVISAYVAHGLDKEKRAKLFSESIRLSKGLVIFHDYSQNTNGIIKVVEYLEDGDYFNFINDGLKQMQELFSDVQIIPVNKYNNWYICTP